MSILAYRRVVMWILTYRRVLMSILSYRRVVICWQIISFILRNCMFSMSVIFLVKPYFFVFPHQDSDEIDTIIEVSNLYNICLQCTRPERIWSTTVLYGLCHNLYRNEWLMAIIELYTGLYETPVDDRNHDVT